MNKTTARKIAKCWIFSNALQKSEFAFKDSGLSDLDEEKIQVELEAICEAGGGDTYGSTEQIVELFHSPDEHESKLSDL